MTTTKESQPQEDNCSKRLWVLLTLSDDELMEQHGGLPTGLAFHLSRCESCRALADQIRGTIEVLGSLGEVEPSAGLLEAANVQARKALREGARLTGRTEDAGEVQLGERGSPLTLVPRYRRVLAAAAVLAFAATIWGLVSFGGLGELLVDAGSGARPVRTKAPGWKPATGGGKGETADTAEVSRDEQEDTSFVEAEQKVEGPPAAPHRIVRFHSHIDAAFSDEPGGARPIVVLPDPRERNLGWAGVFDKPRSPESTTRLRDDR